jgi:hypothetical protein
MTDKEQLEALLNDMKALKSSVRRNQSTIRAIMTDGNMGILSLTLGLSTLAFCLACHFLSLRFGGFGAIPAWMRLSLLGFIALSFLAGLVLKFVFMDFGARKLRKGLGIIGLMKLFFSPSMIHSSLATILLMGGGSALAALSGQPWLALPIVFCLMVIPFNAIANLTGLGEYYACGYANLAAGFASFFLIGSAPFLAFALASCATFFSYSFCTVRALRRRGGK